MSHPSSKSSHVTLYDALLCSRCQPLHQDAPVQRLGLWNILSETRIIYPAFNHQTFPKVLLAPVVLNASKLLLGTLYLNCRRYSCATSSGGGSGSRSGPSRRRTDSWRHLRCGTICGQMGDGNCRRSQTRSLFARFLVAYLPPLETHQGLEFPSSPAIRQLCGRSRCAGSPISSEVPSAP